MEDRDPRLHRTLLDYIEYFEKLNARSIRLIEKLVEPGIRFKDPFNDVMGVDAVERIFEHMFENLEFPKFKVRDYSWSEREERMAYIRWSFSCKRKGHPYAIEGVSEIMFSKDAKILSHTDYWDSGEYFYEHIPLLGGMIRFVKSKLKV